VARLLDQAWPAFYLGNVAADFQTISDIPREVTHFYRLPPQPGVQAHDVMLQEYPQLADAAALPPQQAVFIAGYRGHLLLDLRWYWDVLMPYFIEADAWPADHRHRFLVHNTLLTYLDKVAFASLPPTAGETLAAARPCKWLPFAGDGDLIRWRDLLAEQLQPDTTLATVTIYAERMKMTPEAFAANLENPQWMQEHVFHKVPLPQVEATITRGMEQSVTLLNEYLHRRQLD
jgi:hypothetical protein